MTEAFQRSSGLPLWEHSSLCSTHTLKSQCPRKAHLLWFSAFEKFSKGSLFPVHLSRPGMVRHATRFPATPTHFNFFQSTTKIQKAMINSGTGRDHTNLWQERLKRLEGVSATHAETQSRHSVWIWMGSTPRSRWLLQGFQAQRQKIQPQYLVCL